MHDARYSTIGYQPEDHTILDTPKLSRHEFDDGPLGLLLHPVLAACLDTISTSLHPRPEAFMHQEPRALPWRIYTADIPTSDHHENYSHHCQPKLGYPDCVIHWYVITSQSFPL
jgi:hypothetical protein